MLLREVELRNWRGLKQMKLGPFKDRLNLITGPNESGKSRVFEAIRFALFESYKGSAQHKLSLQSWDSADAPFVRLVVETDGNSYEIQKQFLKGGSALLTGAGSTLRGEEAEDALRELTGAKSGGARGVNDADMGIWPILLIQQGRATEVPSTAVNSDGLMQLHDRVSAEIGLAAVSPTAQKLMDLARAEYERYYTATGQENRALRDARKDVADKAQAFELASAAYVRQEGISDSIRAAQNAAKELEQRQANLVSDSGEAAKRAEKAAHAAQAVTTTESRVAICRSAKRQADTSLQQRIDLDAVVTRLVEEVAQIQTRIGIEGETRDRLNTDVSTMSKRERDCSASLAQARAHLDIFRIERRRSELTQRHGDVLSAISRVEEITAELESEQQLLAAMPKSDRPLLDKLKALEDAAIRARASLQGAAVSVVIALKRDMLIDGRARRADERINLDIVDDQTFQIGDVAEITVKPGGGALLQLRTVASECEDEFKAALSQAGFESPALATEAFRQRTQSSQAIQSLKDRLKQASEKSLTDLRAEAARIEADILRLGPVQVIDGDEASFDQAVRQGEVEEPEVRSQLAAATASLASCREKISELEGQARSKDDERRTVEKSLSQMRSVDGLQQEAEREQQVLGQAVVDHEAAVQQYNELGGNTAKDDSERARRAVDTIDVRLREARTNVAGLRGELRQIVEAAPYESVQITEAESVIAQKELARLEQRAGAAETLWRTLSESRRKVVERLTQPVIARVQPYLQEIFPGCTLDAGEEFAIHGLKSPQYSEPFSDLSGGSREQLALVTRIGFAEVLAGDGRLPLLLDDALVNTDPGRIKCVHRILDRASVKLQVLVFTCHDILFDSLGAEAVFTLPARR